MLILLGVVIHGVKQFTAENADTKKGIEYIQSKENEEVKVIEQKIASKRPGIRGYREKSERSFFRCSGDGRFNQQWIQ